MRGPAPDSTNPLDVLEHTLEEYNVFPKGAPAATNGERNDDEEEPTGLEHALEQYIFPQGRDDEPVVADGSNGVTNTSDRQKEKSSSLSDYIFPRSGAVKDESNPMDVLEYSLEEYIFPREEQDSEANKRTLEETTSTTPTGGDEKDAAVARGIAATLTKDEGDVVASLKAPVDEVVTTASTPIEEKSIEAAPSTETAKTNNVSKSADKASFRMSRNNSKNPNNHSVMPTIEQDMNGDTVSLLTTDELLTEVLQQQEHPRDVIKRALSISSSEAAVVPGGSTEQQSQSIPALSQDKQVKAASLEFTLMDYLFPREMDTNDLIECGDGLDTAFVCGPDDTVGQRTLVAPPGQAYKKSSRAVATVVDWTTPSEETTRAAKAMVRDPSFLGSVLHAVKAGKSGGKKNSSDASTSSKVPLHYQLAKRYQKRASEKRQRRKEKMDKKKQSAAAVPSADQ